MRQNSDNPRGYENNKAWQVGMEVVADVYRLTKRLPKNEEYGLVSQLRRTAVSIPSNIAEGNAAGSDGLYLRHVRVARGSVGELDTQLRLVEKLGLLPHPVPAELTEQVTRLAKLISGLRRYLRNKRSKVGK